MSGSKLRSVINSLSKAAIDAVLPELFIPSAIKREGSLMRIREKEYDLNSYAHVYIISIGKAAEKMAAALDRIIHPFVTEGIVLAKHLPQKKELDTKYRILKGGHPIPTEDSLAGANEILALADKAGASDLVMFLISGGGSALMTKPAEGISLETFQDFSKAVLGCGADIHEFNTLRKHLDEVKGGRLAQHAAPASQITLILSDVVGSQPEVIASGPTVPDNSTFRQALDILNRYSDRAVFPEIVRKTLSRGCAGETPETLKPDDPAAAQMDVYILAENRAAAKAAAAEGERLGFKASVLNTELTGEAADIGRMLPSFFSELEPQGLLIFGGETTVQLHGNGSGGRNLEMALASVRSMAERPGCVLFTLATDGEDGPTDAAGAFVTADTLSEALRLGCIPEEYLENNDSYHFFEKVNGLIKPGPSGTNVNDLTFLFRI